MTDPWLDKRGIAQHLACSIRSIEYAMDEGMPHTIIFGRPKFQAAQVETWLAHTGKLEHRGDTLPADQHTGEIQHAA